MSGRVKDASEALSAALKLFPNTSHYRDPGAALSLPATVLGPPALLWESLGEGPTSARFLIYIVVDPDEYAAEKLWDLAIEVAAYIDEVTDAAVLRADPGAYESGSPGALLPCYEITVEVSL